MIRDTSQQDMVIQGSSPKRKVLIWGLGFLAIAGLAFFLWRGIQKGNAGAQTEFDRLRTARVELGTVLREISVEGRVVAAFYPSIFSPADGKVELMVRAGEKVKKGQALARITSQERLSRLKQEKSQFEAMEAEQGRIEIQSKVTLLELKQDADLKAVRKEAAIREADRAKQSFEKGLINKADFEKAQDDMRIAALEAEHSQSKWTLEKERLEFEVRNGKSQLKRQQLVLEETQRLVDELELRSPVNGVVGTVDVNPQDAVSMNQSICSVIDLSAFEISVSIPENQAAELASGMEAVIIYEQKPYAARLNRISPEVERGMVEGRLAFADVTPSGLKQNQRVRAVVKLDEKTDVLKVKRGPFLEHAGASVAFRIEENYAHRIEIQTGISSISEIEVLSGLREGDQIIISDTSSFGQAQKVYLKK